MIKTLEDLRLIALPLGAVGAFQRNRTKGVVCCDVSYVYEIECRTSKLMKIENCYYRYIRTCLHFCLTAHGAKMPGTGRPTSPWWAHFQAVEGCIQIIRFLVMNLKCAGDFRVVRCLHSDQLVKKSFLCVVRRQLTPPPSSTNVERLFSYGGLVATDHRVSLSGEKLDQILFLRENALMANFDLGWL